MKTGKRLLVCFLAVALLVAFVPGLWAEEMQIEKVNINKASAEELMQLKGIGPEYAERIIHYRETHGAFERVEDITNIPGIGPKTLEENKDRITLK